MDNELLLQILTAAIKTGTPLLLVALGEMICEKSGVLNLGQEGMMLMGAVCGFIATSNTGSLVFGIMMAMLAGTLMSLLFGVISMHLRANQVATGLALTIFGTGLSAFIGSTYVGQTVKGFQAFVIPGLSDIPFIGALLFKHDPLIYLSWLLAIVVGWFCVKTRGGLILRAVGENPHNANAIGLPVLKVRYLAILFGGAMAGLAGSYMSLVYTPMWMENMTGGRGWIALALVVFASWKTKNLILGAYLFGLASIMHLVLQGLGMKISPSLLAMLPYLATLIVMIFIGSNRMKEKLSAPMSLGQTFDSRV
ncbi:inner-membrane translocator [Tolumonas auensis DSM 9187]|uniref:Inner-membrane translocator n=1 Tax=Tolumonas auensis (strain DSM 9187 / NBRC 110442 / TA 4) TaxID=595494 RepID=C4LER6_TOLAT|nr:ABC transporter permease [Tolumonas auensis]ACQ93083.1 inner-membrane translocator [Tolumonas auensis DSM 9187]